MNAAARQRVLIALIAVVVAGGTALLISRTACNDSKPARSPGAQTKQEKLTPGGTPTNTPGQPKKATPSSRRFTDLARARQRMMTPKRTRAPGWPGAGMKKTKMLFGDDCFFGVSGHCTEWRTRASKCDGGDAEACEGLGNLLISESPMQPLWGSMLLQRACALGRSAACARGEQWYEWSVFGYAHKRLVANVPDGLESACTSGNQVACGLLQMRNSKDKTDFDEKTALASCSAGFRDVCGTIAASAATTSQSLAALKAGCETPDAYLCWHLSVFYSARCASEEYKHCPAPDPAKEAHYHRLACQLDPAMHQCKTAK